jgi:glycosyltransferase involved in cell wall biosynthesis
MENRGTRVAHVITTFSLGGATETVLLIAAGLKATGGFDVTVIAGEPIAAEGGMLSEAAEYGIDVEIVPCLQRDIHPMRDLRAFFNLYNLFRERRFDVVHVHSSKAGILARLAARLAGVPVVVFTLHSLPYTVHSPRWLRAMYNTIERIASRWCTGLVSVTHDVVRRAIEQNIFRPGACHVIRSAMDLDRFMEPGDGRDRIRREWGVSPDHVVMGTVGRVHTGKGQNILVDAAPSLCAELPDLRIVIIGTGPLKEPLTQRVAELGLSDRVLFVGSVPPEQMPKTLSALDVFILVSEREGLARVIIQSLAARKPVISYDLDGSPEVVSDRVNGRLIPPDDTAALLDSVRELVRDAELRRKWGDAGPPAVDPEFRAETMVQQTIEEYTRLLRISGQSAPSAGTVPPVATWK